MQAITAGRASPEKETRTKWKNNNRQGIEANGYKYIAAYWRFLIVLQNYELNPLFKTNPLSAKILNRKSRSLIKSQPRAVMFIHNGIEMIQLYFFHWKLESAHERIPTGFLVIFQVLGH
jgi:hypothetical protein